MNTLTYKQAYDKIIDAYFKDEIKPFDSAFCFCGTLAGTDQWDKEKEHAHVVVGDYSVLEYKRMEKALMLKLGASPLGYSWGMSYKKDKNFEDLLFAGMAAALEVLKQIHIERGEIIDEVPEFTKRILA